MGSHVDTPEWQSFERRMQERYRSRRRRMRLRWAILIVAALVIGVSVAPPVIRRQQPASAPHRVEKPDAVVVSLQRRNPTVTVLRYPFAPTVVSEQSTDAAAPVEVTSPVVPAARAPSVRVPTSGSEPEPEPEAKPEARPAVEAEPPPMAPPPTPPAETKPAEPIAPLVSTLPESRSAPPAAITNPAPAVVNVEQDVRKVIERYRDAYERLDAKAARAIWPGVDEAALARAFDGLTSQRIEFERCDIWRDAQAAFATCAGRASYVPKVGRAQNDVPRSWHFRFRRRPVGWTIESAEVR
jgi:hypothetical protein